MVISRQNVEWQQGKEGEENREIADGMHCLPYFKVRFLKQ
jgi:hypothetical protein